MPHPTPLRLAGVALAFLLLVGALLLGGKLRTIDRQLDAALARERTAPARVYAAPYRVASGARVEWSEVEAELGRLHYRERPPPLGPGTWHREGELLQLYLRGSPHAQARGPAGLAFVVRRPDGRLELRDGDGRPWSEFAFEPAEIGLLGDGGALRSRVENPPPLLVPLLLAVEDRRFHAHGGVDLRATLRATWRNLRAGRVVQGGSTVTQQLARTLALDQRRAWSRKLDEALLAFRLERRLSKDELLDLYLAEVYLGQAGGHALRGFAEASLHYFGRPLPELGPEQVALLVGVVRGPMLYHPRRAPERARARRDFVLTLAGREGLLEPAEVARARARPLGIVPPSVTTPWLAPLERVRRELRAAGLADAALAGAHVYTTLEIGTQARAQETLRESLADPELLPRTTPEQRAALDGSIVVLRHDGGVRALVGGRSLAPGFNRALDARRPIGSLVKPFVYLAALASGRYTAASLVDDHPTQWFLPDGETWMPANLNRDWGGPIPLVRALAESSNLASVNVGFEVGIGTVLETLRRFGPLEGARPVPAMLLGAVSLPPLEVAQLYAALANGGARVQPWLVERVVTARGEVHRLSVPPERAADPLLAHQVSHMLTQVIDRGTGAPARRVLGPRLRVAGKTGTSDRGRDSWFAGYSGRDVVVVWLGRDDYQPTPLLGSTGALPVWARLVRALDTEPWNPPRPAALVQQWVDAESGVAVPGPCAGTAWSVLLERDRMLPRADECVPPADPLSPDAWRRRTIIVAEPAAL